MTATGTEARVCQDIAERQLKGTAKYGTTVEGNPLGMVQWIRHAYEECLDQAVYLRRCLEVLEGAQSTTLEDGSVLTATGPIENNPHAEMKKTWVPGQRYQWREIGTEFWRDGAGGPLWNKSCEYRRHPDDVDQEKPWVPDDSGKWIEIAEDEIEVPQDIRNEELCYIMYDWERNERRWQRCWMSVRHLDIKDRKFGRIVAIRKIDE